VLTTPSTSPASSPFTPTKPKVSTAGMVTGGVVLVGAALAYYLAKKKGVI
jgi:hypothetical protein